MKYAVILCILLLMVKILFEGLRVIYDDFRKQDTGNHHTIRFLLWCEIGACLIIILLAIYNAL
jgi:hypothetical protein